MPQLLKELYEDLLSLIVRPSFKLFKDEDEDLIKNFKEMLQFPDKKKKATKRRISKTSVEDLCVGELTKSIEETLGKFGFEADINKELDLLSQFLEYST